MNVECPYCRVGADLVDGKVLFGKNTNYGLIYLCRNHPLCHAHVGAHRGTHTPKGTLANAELRRYRKEAHDVIDQWWTSEKFTRSYVYQILAQQMSLPKEKAHVGLFGIEECQKVIEIFSWNLPKIRARELPILKKNR